LSQRGKGADEGCLEEKHQGAQTHEERDLTRRAVLAAGRRWWPVATPLLGATGWAAPVAEAATTTNQQTNADRAVAAYNAMQKYFYVQGGTSLYRETYPWTGAKKYSYLWPFSGKSA
jgi:hypothetical protein